MRQIRYIILVFLLVQFRFASSQNTCGAGNTIIHSIKTSIDTLLFCASDNFRTDSLSNGNVQTFLNRKIVHSCGYDRPVKCIFRKDSSFIIQYAISYNPKLKLYNEIPGIKYYYWVSGDSIKVNREFIYKVPILSQADIHAITDYFYSINKKTDFTELKDKIIMLFYCSLNGNKKAYKFWGNLDKYFGEKTYLQNAYGGEPSKIYNELDWWMKNLKYSVKNWY